MASHLAEWCVLNVHRLHILMRGVLMHGVQQARHACLASLSSGMDSTSVRKRAELQSINDAGATAYRAQAYIHVSGAGHSEVQCSVYLHQH